MITINEELKSQYDVIATRMSDGQVRVEYSNVSGIAPGQVYHEPQIASICESCGRADALSRTLIMDLILG